MSSWVPLALVEVLLKLRWVEFSTKLPKLDDPQNFCHDHTVSKQASSRCTDVLAAQDGLENLLSPTAVKCSTVPHVLLDL